jgi:glycosyltransferase involved in cell wall biosynthesis
MINNKKLVVVLPAYNAEKTLVKTYKEIPRDIVDEIILTDDDSTDKTSDVSRKLGIITFRHSRNKGYGGNQKTCYKEALKLGADIVVMVHPDYQYTPKLITALAAMLAYDVYDIALGSRIIGQNTLNGGMPFYKYISNRFLTFVQNLLMGQKLSEYHTGYRAFTKEVLKTLPLEEDSDDFIFDNEMLAQACFFGFKIGEISCPTKYFPQASSINFRRSLKYGFGCINRAFLYFIAKHNIYTANFLSKKGQRLA